MKKQYGEIPEKTKIMTFHSFIYQFFILPYKPTISRVFEADVSKVKGISLDEPPQQYKGNRYNYEYIPKDKIEHYTKKDKWYCSCMTELICNTKKEKLLERGIKNLYMFFDKIYIDEFQDFREHDYEFLEKILKKFNEILAVGDYYQHSVNGKNNLGKPFKNINYDKYFEKMKKLKIEVDDKSLSTSRRCPQEICDFVRKKLEINIFSDNTNKGKVIFLNSKEVTSILENEKIKKLVLRESEKYNFNGINWGYSKGDTYNLLSVITLNKLYVALTRTKGNLYIVKKSQFDLVKKRYEITKR